MSRLLFRRSSKEDAPPEGSTFLEDEPSSSSSSSSDGDDHEAAHPSPYHRRRLPTAALQDQPGQGNHPTPSLSDRLAPTSKTDNDDEDADPGATHGPQTLSASASASASASPSRTSLAQRIANFGKAAARPKRDSAGDNHNNHSSGSGSTLPNSSAGAAAALSSPTGVKDLVVVAVAPSPSPSPNKALIKERIARHLLQRRSNPNVVDRGGNDHPTSTTSKKVSIGHASNTATSTQEDDLMIDDDHDDDIEEANDLDDKNPTSDPVRNRVSQSSPSRKKSGGRNSQESSPRPRPRAPPGREDVRSSQGPPSKQRPSLVKALAPPSMADVTASATSDHDDIDDMNRSHCSSISGDVPIASPRRGRKKATVDPGAAPSQPSPEGGPIRASAMDRYFAKVQELRSRSRSRSASREPSTRSSRSVIVGAKAVPPGRSVSGSALPTPTTTMRRRGSGGGASVATDGVGRNLSLESSLAHRRKLHTFYNDNDHDGDTRSVLPEMLRPASAMSSGRSVATGAFPPPSPSPSPSSSRRNRSHTPTRNLTKSPRRTAKDRVAPSSAAPFVAAAVLDAPSRTPMERPSRRSEHEGSVEASPLAVRKFDVESAPSFCRRASHASTATSGAPDASEAINPSPSPLLATPGRPRRADTGSARPSPSRASPAAPKTPDPSPKAKLSGGRSSAGTTTAAAGDAEATPTPAPTRHNAAGDRDLEEMYGPRKASRRGGRPSGNEGAGSHGIDPTTPDHQRPVLFQSPAPKTPTPEEALNMSGSRMLQRSNSTDSSSPGSAVSDPAVERILKMLDDISPAKRSTGTPASPDTPTSIEGCQTPGSSRSVRRSRRIKISANLLSDDEDTIVSQEVLDAAVNAAATPGNRIDRLKKEMLDEVLAARGKSTSPRARRIVIRPSTLSPDPAASPRNGHEVMKEHASKAASLLAKELASPLRSSALDRAKSQRRVEENSTVVSTPVRKARSSRNVTKDQSATFPDCTDEGSIRSERRAPPNESSKSTAVAGKGSNALKTPTRSSHDRSSRSNHERKAKSPRTLGSKEVSADNSPSRSPKVSKTSASRHTLPTRTSPSESKHAESETRTTKLSSDSPSRGSTVKSGSVHEKRASPSRNTSGQSASSKDSVNRSLHKSRSVRKSRSDTGNRHEAEAKLEASSSSLSRKSTSHRSVARSTKSRHDDDPISVNPVEGRKAMKMLRYQSESSLRSNDKSESSPKAGSFAQLQIPGIDCHQPTMGVQFEDC